MKKLLNKHEYWLDVLIDENTKQYLELITFLNTSIKNKIYKTNEKQTKRTRD